MVCPLEVAKSTPKKYIFVLLKLLAKILCHLETNNGQTSIENALLYITAKNRFLKTHIYEKCRTFFERMCGKNLKNKIFEFVGLKSKLIILTSEWTGWKKIGFDFFKKMKYFFLQIFFLPFSIFSKFLPLVR